VFSFAFVLAQRGINRQTKTMKNQVLTNWEAETQKITKFLEGVSNEQLQQQVAPGKNSGVYLLGHLIAANDSMNGLFGFGPQLYPQLLPAFIQNPDGNDLPKPTVDELRQMWHDHLAHLTPKFNELTNEDWQGKHTKVSDEDFAKEPNRNKQNVLLTRTLHQSYHYGQLMLLK